MTTVEKLRKLNKLVNRYTPSQQGLMKSEVTFILGLYDGIEEENSYLDDLLFTYPEHFNKYIKINYWMANNLDKVLVSVVKQLISGETLTENGVVDLQLAYFMLYGTREHDPVWRRILKQLTAKIPDTTKIPENTIRELRRVVEFLGLIH